MNAVDETRAELAKLPTGIPRYLAEKWQSFGMRYEGTVGRRSNIEMRSEKCSQNGLHKRIF